MFSFLLVIVLIHFSIYKILLLLIGRVYTIIKLIRVIDFIGEVIVGGVIGATSRVVAIVVSRVAFI